MRYWLPILCAAVLVAGCGSSSSSGTTATSPVEGSDLQRLPQVPEATGESLSSSPTDTRAFLRQV
jgi:hypothetical protein